MAVLVSYVRANRSALEAGAFNPSSGISAAFAEFMLEDYGARQLAGGLADRSWEYISRYLDAARKVESEELVRFAGSYLRWAGLGEDSPELVETAELKLTELQMLFRSTALGDAVAEKQLRQMLSGQDGGCWMVQYMRQVLHVD